MDYSKELIKKYKREQRDWKPILDDILSLLALLIWLSLILLLIP